jgi:N-acetyl-anhydromuramoyl-L-alanine amidase
MLDAGSNWRGGWLGAARPVRSPNFGARPAAALVDLIVVHSISLPPGAFGGDSIERLFTNRLDWDAHPYFDRIRGLEVSAHFVIDRSGAVVQFVDVFERAWHAGQSAYLGRQGCNDFSVGVEMEGLEGGVFTSAQYKSLAHLCAQLAKRLPIAHITGHEHIAPGRKRDPGPGFDWQRLRRDAGVATSGQSDEWTWCGGVAPI